MSLHMFASDMGEAAEIITVLSAEAHLVRWIDFTKRHWFECKFP